MCPLIAAAQAGTVQLSNGLDSLLTVDTCSLFAVNGQTCNGGTTATTKQKQSSTGFYEAWNAFRLIATAIIIIGGLVMIIGQAVSG
jgi:hypothetical protein